MTITDVLGQLAAGLRLALVLFAVMALLSSVRTDEQVDVHDRLKSWAWTLIAVAVVFFSPVRAATLLGRPTSEWLIRIGDVGASGLSCGAFILLLAARAIRRGLSTARVIRGAAVNIAILFATVGTAWITR